MDSKLKSVIEKTSTAALMIGGAWAGMEFGSPLVGSIVGNILSGMATTRIEGAKLHEIRNLLSRANPAELNHDLEKLIQEALVWTNKNIAYTYEAYCTSEAQKARLEKIAKEITDELKATNREAWLESSQLLNQINGLEDSEALLDSFLEQRTDWPDINPDYPFPKFYKDHFFENFKLCFGELLKNPDRQSALITYNRNISDQIQRNLKDNQATLDTLVASNAELKSALEKLSRTPAEKFEKEYVLPQITIELDKYLEPLHQKVDLLVDQNGKVLETVLDIRRESRIQTQKTEELGRKVEKNIRNKVIYAFILPALAIAVAWLAYRYWQSRQPLVFTVAVENGSTNHELPFEPPTVTLRYGGKTETRPTTQNEAVFKGLPPYLRDDSLTLRVESHGYYPIDTVVAATAPQVLLTLRRNNTYATLQGVVKDADTEARVAGATVLVQNLRTQTNENGYFSLTIPEAQQKTEQRLSIQRSGYAEWNRIEPVIKNVESIIHLKK